MVVRCLLRRCLYDTLLIAVHLVQTDLLSFLETESEMGGRKGRPFTTQVVLSGWVAPCSVLTLDHLRYISVVVGATA